MARLGRAQPFPPKLGKLPIPPVVVADRRIFVTSF